MPSYVLIQMFADIAVSLEREAVLMEVDFRSQNIKREVSVYRDTY
jgi:hypothetical protein